MPDHCNLQTLCSSASNLPNNKLYWHSLSNITLSRSWTRYYKKHLRIPRRAPPLMSTLMSTWHHTHDSFSQAYPLPPFLHTASDQKLEAGMAWEQGRQDYTWYENVTFDSPKVGRCGAGDPEVGSTELNILKFFTKYPKACGGEEPMRSLFDAYRGTFHLTKEEFWLELFFFFLTLQRFSFTMLLCCVFY